MRTPSRTRGFVQAFDPFRDFQAEAQEQQQQAGGAAQTTMTLGKLFAPPIDLIEPGTLAQTQEKGAREGKWIIVNLQKIDEFECTCLTNSVSPSHPLCFLGFAREGTLVVAPRLSNMEGAEAPPHLSRARSLSLPQHRVSRPLHLCSGMAALQLPSRL